MNVRVRLLAVLCCVGLLPVIGCAPKMTIADMKEGMDKMERPAALDDLERFVGEWEAEGEAYFAPADAVLKATGTSKVEWVADGYALMETFNYEMEEFGPMSGVALWTWDAKAKKYRLFSVTSMGDHHVGTMRYFPQTDTWKMSGKSRSEMGNTAGVGTIHFSNDDMTQEWTWNDYGTFLGMRMFKMFEMHGTSQKK